jgi:hypothetical protein
MANIEEAITYLESSFKGETDIPWTEVASHFNCSKDTLRRRWLGVQLSRQDADLNYKTKLTKQEELEIVAYIQKLTLRGLPPALSIVKTFGEEIGKTDLGKSWPARFVKRHQGKLDSKWFEGLDLSRKKADSATTYQAYFQLVRKP